MRAARALCMIGILGGTFDPIHYGHLRPAQEVMRALGLREVRIVPAGRPPHRRTPSASAQDRLWMAQLACAEFPGFIVDAREIGRAGPSYTVDTLHSLRAEIGTTPLCLLLGADVFAGIETWYRWEQVPELAHLVVMQRPGWETQAHDALPGWAVPRLAQNLRDMAQTPAGKLWRQAVTPLDISATRLRAALAAARTAPTELPVPVWEYIHRQHLYVTL